MRSVTHVIINPVSGAKATEEIYKNEVVPLLKELGIADLKEYRTKSEGDAAEIARRIVLDANSSTTAVSMILLGGDGTTHEVINGIVQQKDGKCNIPCNVKLTLIPTGTANALYASIYPDMQPTDKSYKFANIRAMTSSKASSYALALSAVTTNDFDEAKMAHLITSHALHASILADSEALRTSHPGIERFKMAAAKNMTRWTLADITLKGKGRDNTIELYDADSSAFRSISAQGAEFSDPVFYFVCVTTDRLEPTFVPAPLSGSTFSSDQDKKLQRPKDAVDIVIIRPLRNPALQKYIQHDDNFWSSSESSSIREEFAASVVQQVIGGMYDEGKHISMRYEKNGPYICEYYRCGGYEWTPRHNLAKRTCVDGLVFDADHIAVRVLGEAEGAGKVCVVR